jgi:tape measure domain-containing protein
VNSPAGLNVGGVYYDVELNTGQLLQDSRKADSALRGVEFRMGDVALAVKALAAALALVKMAQVADDMRLLAARVEVAAGSMERGAEAMNALARISARTQTELQANVSVFTRLNSSIMQMGGAQQDTLRITELLAMAIKVSGASAGEAASAMTQFGQALGSGQLQGDELRSLLENAPYLMKQLAAGIGVPVGALKKLGEEGKLTADVVTAALTKAAGQIETDFKKLPQTFEAAMMALVDQLRAASKAADDLSGTSAVLTGVARGTAEAVGLLGDQLRAAAGEANGLGRNDAIGEWSRRTTLVLSYVADAADLTWQTLSVLGRNVRFVFEGVGREIGGIGAQIAAVMRGDFAQAKAIGEQIRADAAAARSELDAADARSLGGRQLAGAAMRERMGAMATADASGYQDRSDRMAQGKASRLTAPSAGDPKAAKKAADEARKAADERTRGYLEQVEGERRILEEQDKLTQDFLAKQERRREEEAQAEERARRQREQGQQFALGLQAGNDPIARLQLELETKSALLAQYAAQDQENLALYAAAKVQLEQDTAARITEILAEENSRRAALQSQTVQAYGSLFGSLADLSKQFAGEQSGIFKVMFAASKAFAIADAIIKIQQGIANASSLTYPANLGAMASVAAATGSIVSTIKGTNYGGGRQYGGPVSAGSLYRVNETGAPEMFVGSGGRQYMLPTQGGQVVPADEVSGGGGAVHVVVNNYSGEPVQVRQGVSPREVEIIVGRAAAEVGRQFSSNEGPAFAGLVAGTNARSKL